MVVVEVDFSYWASVVVLVAYSLEDHLVDLVVAGQKIAYSVASGHCLVVVAAKQRNITSDSIYNRTNNSIVI